MNISCALDWQCVFNHLAAITQAIGTFCWHKIDWLNSQLFVRKVWEDVESPPVQKLYAWLTSLLAGVVVHLKSVPVITNPPSIHWQFAVIHQISEVTYNLQQECQNAKMLWCTYASFRLHLSNLNAPLGACTLEWLCVLLCNLGSRTLLTLHS